VKVGEEGPGWWRRERVDEFLRPMAVDDPTMLRFLAGHGFVAAQGPAPARE